MFEFGFLHDFRELCLTEWRKVRPLGGRVGDVRLRRLLREISANKHALIGHAGRCGIGKTFALRDRDALPSVLADLQDEPPLDVERNHWNAVETCESEYRHVEQVLLLASSLLAFGSMR